MKVWSAARCTITCLDKLEKMRCIQLLLHLAIVSISRAQRESCDTHKYSHRSNVSRGIYHSHCLKVDVSFTHSSCTVASPALGYSLAFKNSCDISHSSVVCYCSRNCAEGDVKGIKNAIQSALNSLRGRMRTNCMREVLKLWTGRAKALWSEYYAASETTASTTTTIRSSYRTATQQTAVKETPQDQNNTHGGSPIQSTDRKKSKKWRDATRSLLMHTYLKLICLFGAICLLMIVQLTFIRCLRNQMRAAAESSRSDSLHGPVTLEGTSTLKSKASTVKSAIRKLLGGLGKKRRTSELPVNALQPSTLKDPTPLNLSAEREQSTQVNLPSEQEQNTQLSMLGERSTQVEMPAEAETQQTTSTEKEGQSAAISETKKGTRKPSEREVEEPETNHDPELAHYRYPRRKPLPRRLPKDWEWM